jgi:hypothetical protein
MALKPLKAGYIRKKDFYSSGNRQIKIGGPTYKRLLKLHKVAKKLRVKKTRTKAKRLLNKNKFEGIRQLIKNKIQFNDFEKNKLFEIVQPMTSKQGKKALKFTLADGTQKIFTIRNDNLIDLAESLSQNYFSQNAVDVGSDVIEQAIRTGITDIEIVNAPKYKKKLKNKSGKFFRYFNNSNIDLTRYQIINDKKQQILLKEHCLIFALRKAGVEKALLNSIKTIFKSGSHFPKKNLNKVSEIIERPIVLYFDRNKETHLEKKIYNKHLLKVAEPIKIGIIEDHYFIYDDKTDFTCYSSKNYEKIKDIENFNNIIKCKNGVYQKSSNEKFKINSFKLISNLLLHSNIFIKDHHILNVIPEYEKNVKKLIDIPLDNIDNEQLLYEPYEPYEKKEKDIYYADLETDTTHDHKPILAGIIKHTKSSYYSTRVFDSETLITDMFKYVKSQSKEQIIEKDEHGFKKVKNIPIVYFHNLKYDFHAMINDIYILDTTEKDGQLYGATILLGKYRIELRDSYKMFPVPLSKFTSALDLPDELKKQEAINYNYYKKENMQKTKVKLTDYMKGMKEKDKIIFKKIMNQDDSYKLFQKEGKYFNPIRYYKHYLRYDVLVLAAGMKKFNDIILKITNDILSIYDSLTISSLTNKYASYRGAFDGAYEMKGNLREYCSKAIMGGRVQCHKEFRKKIINKKIADYDGVSLYPSAIYELCSKFGVPKGKAKRTYEFNKKYLDTKDYYIVTVEISKINKKQQLPFVCYKDNEGILRYTNDIDKPLKVIIDKFTLEDWIEFQNIEYKILDGVYWDEGYNNEFGNIIKELFEERLKAKKKAKKDKQQALQQVIKLMLNSSYGKTIIKKSNTDKQIKRKDLDTTNNYINNHWRNIISYEDLNDKQIIIKKDTIDNSYNMAHIGVAILSISKRIMNRVFDVANNNDIVIYYTDTDSLHCNYDDVPKIEKIYKAKYNKELTGKQLGQFHIDFKLHGACDEIYATQSIFLNKKAYIDKLESKNEKGETITGYHYRLKGVTDAGILYKAKQDYDNNLMKLYEELTKNSIEFCLNPENKVMFEYSNHRVYTRKPFTFYRTVDFT